MTLRFALSSFGLAVALTIASCSSSSSSPATSSGGTGGSGGSTGATSNAGAGASAGGTSSAGTAGSEDVAGSAGDSGSAGVAGGESDDAGTDASSDVTNDVDKSATCAMTFGSSLTNAFGRVDGTVVAVVPPNDQACAMPNMTHLVIQVAMNGDTYRMVVDVLSTSGDPNVRFHELDAPLAAGAWLEGWHPGVALDYPTTLGVHSTDFSPMAQADLVATITNEITLGDHISIFATSQNEPASAHLVHREGTNIDGAIVVHPESPTPHWLLCAFSEQTF